MAGQPEGRRVRSRATAVAAASVLLVLGPLVAAAPADADPLTTIGCPATTSSVPSGTGTAAGLAGAVQSLSSGAADVAGCAAGAVVGGSSTAPSLPAPAASSVPVPVPAAEPVALVGQPPAGDEPGTAPAVSGTATSTASAAAEATPATLRLERSSTSVYPVKDGYRDRVRIAVRTVDAAGEAVAMHGTAVLSKGRRALLSWTVDGEHHVITWDGRVQGAIRPGLYTIAVTAVADGSALTARTHVRVLAAHLEKHAVVVRSDVGARSVFADLPKRLLKAYATGGVSVRLQTAARVAGRARLVFTAPGTTRALSLRDGVHTTAPMPVPPGFSHVTITRDWAKGAAHLRSLHAIWTYYTLS